MAKASTSWAKGVSGNPNGAAKKADSLSELLRLEGDELTKVARKGEMTKKQALTHIVYEALLTGTIRYANGKTLTLDGHQYLRLLEFVYNRVDGAPKATATLVDTPSAQVLITIPSNGRDQLATIVESEG